MLQVMKVLLKILFYLLLVHLKDNIVVVQLIQIKDVRMISNV